MQPIIRYLAPFLAIAFALMLAGCTSTPAPVTPAPTATPTALPATTSVPSPSVTILSPMDGSTVTAGNVTVGISVSNFNIVDKQGQASVPGQGHVHYYMDVSPIPNTPGQPAIPANANAVWAHVAATSYTFTNVPPGTHTFTVQLANNDHTPVQPPAVASVTVTAGSQATTAPVTTAPATTAPPATTATQTGGGGQTVQMTLTAQNIAFDKTTLTAPAGSTVVMTFVNMDAGVPHNFALYTDSTANLATRFFAGNFVTGVMTVTYTFTAPSKPGTYFFRCDVHPIMSGSFIAM